jgi:hypothetical protein
MSVFVRLWKTLVGIARELSDESAYARHLSYTGRLHSLEEWRSFSDVRLRRKYQQGKCC